MVATDARADQHLPVPGARGRHSPPRPSPPASTPRPPPRIAHLLQHLSKRIDAQHSAPHPSRQRQRLGEVAGAAAQVHYLCLLIRQAKVSQQPLQDPVTILRRAIEERRLVAGGHVCVVTAASGRGGLHHPCLAIRSLMACFPHHCPGGRWRNAAWCKAGEAEVSWSAHYTGWWRDWRCACDVHCLSDGQLGRSRLAPENLLSWRLGHRNERKRRSSWMLIFRVGGLQLE